MDMDHSKMESMGSQPEPQGSSMSMCNGMMMMDMGMMMQMYFQFTQKATILFEGWQVDSVGGIIGSIIAVFFMGLFFEAFKTLRDHITVMQNKKNKLKGQTGACSNWQEVLIQTLMQMVQLTWAYFLMLIFMTYNAWLCIAVVLGDGVGYLIFFNRRPLALTTNEEDCCGS